jgi:hypothetical protein
LWDARRKWGAWTRCNRSVTCHSAWAAEVPDHAAARFLQRAAKADLRDALFAAGLAFLAADAATVVPLVGQDTSMYCSPVLRHSAGLI